MAQEIITVKSGKINDYLHHFDLKQLGTKRMLSGYIAEFDDCAICMDIGSSFEVKHLLRYAKRNKIPLSSFKYLITSHHHFDHNGGMWKLYEEIKRHNPEVKILTNQQTKDFLNNYEAHLKRARRGFGNMVGIMKAIEDQAFKIINGSEHPTNLDIIDKFNINGSEVELAILKTPGHTYDHQCTIFLKNGEIDFIFLGEAAGTMYHSSKLLTLPVSAPIHYNFNEDMETIGKLIKLRPQKVGFSHFGIINGKENVREILSDHESFMKEFRARIIEYHKELDETRYICEKITPFLLPRTDMFGEAHLVIQNMVLQAVYGVMMDLGYRND